MDVVPT